jgi:hypothetical protein
MPATCQPSTMSDSVRCEPMKAAQPVTSVRTPRSFGWEPSGVWEHLCHANPVEVVQQ